MCQSDSDRFEQRSRIELAARAVINRGPQPARIVPSRCCERVASQTWRWLGRAGGDAHSEDTVRRGAVFRIFLAAGKARHSRDCEPQPVRGTAPDDGCFWGGEGLLTTHKGLSSLKREWPLWQYSPCHGASMTGFSNFPRTMKRVRKFLMLPNHRYRNDSRRSEK